MSVAKLLLSGLLVSSGLILGAFTLHRHFASQGEPQTIAFVESHSAPRLPDAAPEPRRAAPGVIAPEKWAPRLVRAESEADAEAKARKRQAAAEKKAADKRLAQKKAKEDEEPQTMLPWLWNLISNSGSSSGK